MSSISSLRRDALSLPALFFCIATAAAPMTALLFNVRVIVSGAGWAAPAAFLVAAAMLAVFSVGYVQMSGRVRSTGGFYAFVTHGPGRPLGLGTAAVVTGAYAILSAAVNLLLDNRGSLAAADGVPFVGAIPLVGAAVFGVGVVASLWRDRSSAVALEGARS